MDKNSVSVGTQYIICECGDNFPNEELLNIHLVNDHGTVEIFQCDVCRAAFSSQSQLHKHSADHATTKEKLLEATTKIEAKNEKKPPVIKFLKLKRIDSISLIQHLKSCSGLIKLPPAPVPLRESETYQLTMEEPHQVVVTSEVQEPEEVVTNDNNDVIMDFNDEKLDQEMAVEIEVEDTIDKPPHKAAEQVIYYKCDLCKILYPSQKAYNTHFAKKHESQSCQEAPTGYKFIEQDLSGDARRPPPGEDEFCCEFCPKTFSIKRSMLVHRRLVHADRLPESGPAAGAGQPNRSKVCDICDRAFASYATLVDHQRTHTGEKPYQCTECPKRFSVYQLLQIHLRTHTGERPYKCTHCPKAFIHKAALNRHDRVHTGAKPYTCPHCGKAFSQSNSMKMHVKTVHLKMPAPYRHRRNKNE